MPCTVLNFFISQSLQKPYGVGFINRILLKFFRFKKLYFIDYAITVVPIFPSVSPSTQHTPLPQAIPPLLFTFMGHECKFFGYSISYTVLYIPIL